MMDFNGFTNLLEAGKWHVFLTPSRQHGLSLFGHWHCFLITCGFVHLIINLKEGTVSYSPLYPSPPGSEACPCGKSHNQWLLWCACGIIYWNLSVFKVPLTLSHKVETIFASFWILSCALSNSWPEIVHFSSSAFHLLFFPQNSVTLTSLAGPDISHEQTDPCGREVGGSIESY